MDLLEIKGLVVYTSIGTYEWEQQIKQKLSIDIAISLNTNDCQDCLSNTLDYEALCNRVTNYVENNSFNLIETVANKLADLIKNELKIKKLTISVSKPHAIKNTNDIRITIKR